MPNFLVTIKHDSGTTKIQTFASDPEAAARLIMEAEACPRSAIKKIKDLTPDKVYHLIAAIQRANTAAIEAARKNPDDGGTCNLDSVIIKLDRWKAEDIKAVSEATGASISHQLSGWHKGYRFLGTTAHGQAGLRTRMVEAAEKSLKAENPALDISIWYHAD